MKFTTLLLAAVPAAMAYPGMLGEGASEHMLAMLKEKRDASQSSHLEERQVLTTVGGVLTGLGSTIKGLLGSVASEINLNNLRPEPGYEFKAPSPSDYRGPCPGLNLLANHGYLPRNGHVNFGQVLEATARGFNMHPDLATVLLVFAILADGDIATESFYLSVGPSGVGGLNRHSTVEADVSPNREDFYNGCGDNHHLSSRLFTQNVNFAKDGSGFFDINTMAKHYGAQAGFAKQNNPFLYYFPFPSIVSVGAYAFYPNFFSNGTYGLGGVANYESISSIIGAQYNPNTDTFDYVPERFPPNWYRRAVPYGAVTTLVDGFLKIYPANPIGMPIGQLGTPNFNVTNILCDLVQGIGSITPYIFQGTVQETEAAIAWAVGKFADVGLTGTILGCPPNSLSNTQFYPNPDAEGGPRQPPPAVLANAGNNVYGKTYFKNAPVKPDCTPAE